MKRYIYVGTAIAAFCSIILVSCKKNFLEVVPKGNIVAVTYDDYNKLMNGSNFYVLGGGSYGVFQAAAIMGDEVSAETYAYNKNENIYTPARSMFQWNADIFPLTPTSLSKPSFMANLLSNIYSLNKIIAEVDNSTNGSSQQKKQLKAEALTERAFTNFLLINYFTKPYNAATASSDPGFPVIKIPDVAETSFSRGTVQQSYDFMIGDLTEAITALPVSPAGPTRISKSAAEGILGKIYLFMGRYSDALAMLKKSFADMAGMTNAPVLYDYNQTLAPGGSFLPIDPSLGPNSPFLNATDVKESVWAVFTYAQPYSGNFYPTDFLTIANKTVDLFSANDWRRKFYTDQQTDQQTPVPGGRLRRYNLEYIRIGVELPDLLLLKAEAEARTGDLGSAQADVMQLRRNRIPPAEADIPADATASAGALTKFIIDERIREFAAEGHRWFDMRRLSTDPLFSVQPAAQHTVYQDATNGTTYTLKPERLTLRIPPAYLVQNPGMVDNP